MTKFDNLIQELCPDGVRYKSLGEVGLFFGGLTGKSKEDFVDGNAKFITYKNVYSNPALRIDVDDKVKISADEKQNLLQYGDVIFTGSSETLEECGLSSVVTTETNEKMYLNSFCFFLRFNDGDLFLPDFSKHLFRLSELRQQIKKTASGTTRFNVSKEKMKKVVIPVPPLPVQCEIVRILDNFTELTTELTENLTKELTARKQQYAYYRDKLLDRPYDSTKIITIGALGSWSGGKTPSMDNSDYWENGTTPWITSKDMKVSILEDTEDHITEKAVSEASMTVYPPNGVAVVTRSGILKHTLPVAFVPFETTVNQDIKMLVTSEGVLPRYAFHAIQGKSPDILSKAKKQGGTVDSLEFKKFLDYKIPLPSLEVQKRLVEVLDNFDAICTDLSSGLPAEIEARQKQYEYYRDKLLSFEEKI